jgi:tRNA(Ile)-lysidine synthase
VLVHLFLQIPCEIAIAHCNFNLRAEESDGDEAFILELAQKFKIPFFSVSFNTKKIAKERKISIQMAARDLRYQWLENIRKTQGFDFIATAHHLDDSIETLLLNLTNGCGIRGLHGIAAKNEETKIIRPLIFATKQEIVEYAKKNNISFREDSSNKSVKYSRNLIRQLVVPILKSINPSLEQSFSNNFKHFRESEILFDYAINKLSNEILEQADNDELFKIDLALLQNIPAKGTVLFEMIYPYGFNYSQVSEILQHASNTESAVYESSTHVLFRNYKKLILKKKVVEQLEEKLLLKEPLEGQFLFKIGDIGLLNFEPQNIGEFDIKKTTDNVAYFDADELQYPLSLRYYKSGDYFEPFGMAGKRKKLSSFFKDEKIPQNYRSKIPLLLSNDKIIWVIGHRTSETFKVKPDTKNIVKISFMSSLNHE